MQQAMGTVSNHTYANLTDEQAARLEGHARQFYRRALELINATGCSLQQAIQAIQDADRVQQ